MAHVREFSTGANRDTVESKPFDIGWAVGLYDEGEGHARAHGEGKKRKDGTRHLRFTLQIGMLDRTVLERFQSIVKCGNIIGPYPRQQGRTAPLWQWYVSKGPALQVAHLFLPCLSQKRRQPMERALRNSHGPYEIL